MARPVLVDSCWYITMMARRVEPLKQLHVLSLSRDISTCGVIKSEVGRGLKEKSVLERFKTAWSVMLYVDSDFRLWEETMSLAWELDRKGIVLPLQDVHIACCARRIGAVILTFDNHFAKIPGVDATDRVF